MDSTKLLQSAAMAGAAICHELQNGIRKNLSQCRKGFGKYYESTGKILMNFRRSKNIVFQISRAEAAGEPQASPSKDSVILKPFVVLRSSKDG